ncbi:MAG TPA: AAA family ATPase [Chlamydiales bacterium]|nr:AAA family ATPase [Chlamydiales bacterium]
MLIQLKIQNLILVDRAEIAFENGLNILTGETGAGKSAILSAIRLIAGERADPGLIGKHGEIAIVEAALSVYSMPEELEKPEEGTPLIIRREISKLGKNRCFANDQQISLNTLRQIVGHSFEIVDQSSSHLLSSLNTQRTILDTYCETIPLIQKLETSFHEQQLLQKRNDELLEMSETRTRDLQWLEEDLQFIEEVHWKQDEEEKLHSQHHLLTHSQELIEKMDSLATLLNEIPMNKAAQLLDRCAMLDSSLRPQAETLKSIRLELEEVLRNIISSMNRLEADPTLLGKVEERISQIEQLKRRFGKTFSEVQEKKRALFEKVEKLKNLESELQITQKQLSKKTLENQELAQIIREKRKKHASPFSHAILNELHSLNLPNAQFSIEFQESNLCAQGIDTIAFLFSANVGHLPVPISDCASGGELSRLLFSMKVILSGKENNACIIFDEIDSNVGGQTASILGDKLKQISQKKQVICVTHFVQVARLAQTHFAVRKLEELGKTQVNKLNESEKQQEYQRMLGVVKNTTSL